MPSAELPKHAQILVIGGGPGGSYTASALAREGYDVVLFEAAKFPRYHIGESLIPSVRHFLRFIDAEHKVIKHGFARKPGSAIKFNQYMQEGYTDFVALGASNSAWNVVRSEFDHLLLQHAAASGAHVYEQTRVTEIHFEETPPASPIQPRIDSPLSRQCQDERPTRPVPRRRTSAVEFALNDGPSADSLGRPQSVSYETAFGGTGEITFDYLVDASGRAGLMSTKYLKNRKFNASLKNVAVWGYWKNTGMYGQGTDRENAPFFEALSDESGWAWFIPLHKGLTSVGIVMDQKQLGIRSRASSSASGSPSLGNSVRRDTLSARTSSTLAERYLSFLELAPGVLDLIGDGELVSLKTDEDDDEDAEIPVARSASDYSYSASHYAGPGWRLVGDAGSFIDPFFSSGVHLAMTGALSAAASIAASIRGDCPEADAAAWYSSRVSVSYTRFLIVVLSAYKQIRCQSEGILADVDEDNFDAAFAFLRPVIQGGADMGARLSEDEVQRALDFCVHLFDPTTPEQHESARRKIELASGLVGAAHDAAVPDADPLRLLDVRAPVVDPVHLEQLLRQQLHLQENLPASASGAHGGPPRPPDIVTQELSMVLNKVNARRVIHSEHGNGLNSLEEEELAGYALRLRLGELGLRRAGGDKGAGTRP
ncbi:FAD/NAD-P-binding domain-containing protein [Trametes versicolor FP-101664 SS1]|uniref:FAD/NAD-P-binding domain-containing protein n=1 Tax=Trametes versicolor (strain FP-101664) TaxID=717944 RepID=UPI000462384D|nr:FAD/NAD-P-binding domain-containing protein [Trametes versicolor FP-101664 SS1]EIW62958.1 FAD/NAD-P-binding domain-containing protein [Trametes versicolor FP-101664 SS1]